VVKENVKVKLNYVTEEVIETFSIYEVELLKGHYEDTFDEKDIKIDPSSVDKEDLKLIKKILKDEK